MMPLCPGDLLLTRSVGKPAMLNLFGQSVVARRRAGFTHASLCLSLDILLDTRPFEHVRLRSVFDEVRGGGLAADADLLVLRNPTLSATRDAMDDTLVSLIGPLHAQLDKQYNWLFGLTQSSDRDPATREAERVFCSELCVQMLRAVDGFGDVARRASWTLPIHLEALLDRGWVDASAEWRAQLRAIEGYVLQPGVPGHVSLLQREDSARQMIETTMALKTIDDSLRRLQTEIDATVGTIDKVFDDFRRALGIAPVGGPTP